ncbi:MAG: sigma-54-dependent Fis family transcriptional regulator [Planctomycetota bacterium]|nr:MAG: sigma-54-dependent Fis family transcriptional regulator [Planctomycetota bacterium]
MDNESCHILIVEDDLHLRELLTTEVSEAQHQVTAVASAEAAQAELQARYFDLVITDLRLPGADGMALLKLCQSIEPPPAVMVITAFGSVPQAVAALRAGAADFITKPLDLDQLQLAIQRALRVQRLQREVEDLHGLLDGQSIPGLVGQSRTMQSLVENIALVARSAAPVLITGESGVGKELVARGIARFSKRKHGEMVAVNCASIPEQLLESEFFGHRAGAFSGADAARSGLFAHADGGTLLLDEIGELPLAMQAKLLRVLQEGCIRPVGNDQERPVDVRILAATNRNLEEEVQAGRFREDLYYRLETFTLEVPPLRDRGLDIELLAVHFLQVFAKMNQRPAMRLSSEALEVLRHYPFPGNVRELRNAMERAATLARSSTIEVWDLPPRLRQYRRSESAQHFNFADILEDGIMPSLEEVQQRYVAHVLERTQGNKRRAASLLGIGRRTLYRWLNDSDPD